MPARHDDADEEFDDDRDDPSAADMARFGGDEEDDDGGDYDDAAFDDQPGRWEKKPGLRRTVFAVVGVLLAVVAAIILAL